MNLFRNAAVLTVWATLSTACGGVSVMVPRMKPAEVDLAGYRRIGVGTIQGKTGDQIRSELTTALVQTGRFDVLERQKLDAIIEEQNLGATGRFDDETVASIGHLVGTAALVIGDISDARYEEKLEAKKTTCSKRKNKKTVKYPCTQYSRTAQATLQVNLQVVDTESGQVLAGKTLEATKRNRRSKTDAKPAPFNAESAWLADCRSDVIGQFVKVIAPYEVKVRVKLKEDGDYPQLEQGNNFAKIGNWAEARRQYLAAQALADADPDSGDARAKILYNLGVAAGYSGSYDEGIRLLEQSYGLDPDKDTAQQIQSLKQFKADDTRLEEQRRGAVENES